MEYTAKSIINRAFNLADLKNTDFISYEEQEQYLNDAFISVMSSLINKGVKQFVREVSLTGQSFYPFTEYTIPHDMYQICSVKTPNGFIYTRKSESQPLGSNTYDVVNDKLRIYGSPITSNIIVTYWVKPLYLSFPNKDIETSAVTSAISSAGNSVLTSDGEIHNCLTDESLGVITLAENNKLGNGHVIKYGLLTTQCGLIGTTDYVDINGNEIEKPYGELESQTYLGQVVRANDKLYTRVGGPTVNVDYYTYKGNKYTYNWGSYSGYETPSSESEVLGCGDSDIFMKFDASMQEQTFYKAVFDNLGSRSVAQRAGTDVNYCQVNGSDFEDLSNDASGLWTTRPAGTLPIFGGGVTISYGPNRIADGTYAETLLIKDGNGDVFRFSGTSIVSSLKCTSYTNTVPWQDAADITWDGIVVTFNDGIYMNIPDSPDAACYFYVSSINLQDINPDMNYDGYIDGVVLKWWIMNNGSKITKYAVEDYSNYTIKPVESFSADGIVEGNALNQATYPYVMQNVVDGTLEDLTYQTYVAAQLKYVDYNDNTLCSTFFNTIEGTMLDNEYNAYYSVWNPSTNYYDWYLFDKKVASTQANYILKYDDYFIDDDFNLYDLDGNKLSNNPEINDTIDAVYPVEKFDERVAFIFGTNGHYYLNTLNEDFTWHTEPIDNKAPLVKAILKYGLLVSNGTYTKITSYIPDTALNFPNQLLWQIMACDLAIRFVLKQNGDVTSLNTLYQDMWLQFMNTIDMDADYDRIKNVY